MEKKKIVSIGGGTGQSVLLSGLKKYPLDITAIVPVTDTGRSTGILRKKFNIAAPGDIRNVILSLSNNPRLRDIFQYRFDRLIKGMNLGNLLLVALIKLNNNDFGKAISEFSSIFNISGRVYPVTTDNINIAAELADGTIVNGEVNIRKPGKAPIKKIFIKEKKVKVYKPVLKSIKEADVIVIGPGSLYTSILPILIFPEISHAINNSNAVKIYIPNLVTQHGQTDNYSLRDHVDAIRKFIKLDYIIINTKKPSEKILRAYEKESSFYIDVSHLPKDIKAIRGDLLDDSDKATREYGKALLMRHNPEKLSKAVYNIINPTKPIIGVILAAGHGTRMKPFSLFTSKVMLPFLGKPLIEYHIREMRKEGIKEIIIIANDKNISEIKSYFKNYRDIKYAIQDKQLGPSHALLSAREYLNGSYFLLKYGDSLSYENQIHGIMEVFRKLKNPNGIVTLRDVDNPSEYGIARFSKGKLIEIVEKPKKDFPSKLANVGLAILDSEKFFNSIDKHGYSKVLPPPQYLLQDGHSLDYWISRSERVDVGRPYDIILANEILIRKYGPRRESIHISKKSRIGENVHLGPNAIIEDNVVIDGYSSIDAHIGKGSVIMNSIIMKGSRISENCHIENSVIGINNTIGKNFRVKSKKAVVAINGKQFLSPIDVGIFTGNDVVILDNLSSLPGKIIFPNKVIKEDIRKDKRIRAILFDADNTLYNTKEVSKLADMSAMNYLSKHTDIPPDRLYDKWKKIVLPLVKENEPRKRHRKYSYSLLMKKCNIKADVNHAYRIFLESLIKNLKPMPYLLRLIPQLKKYRCAVISEDFREPLKLKLKKFNLDKLFMEIISSEDIGEMKPSMEYYRRVFSRFNVPPSEVLVIGDNPEKDLIIPKKMGATVVLFGGKQAGIKPDFAVSNYKEFAELLKEI